MVQTQTVVESNESRKILEGLAGLIEQSFSADELNKSSYNSLSYTETGKIEATICKLAQQDLTPPLKNLVREARSFLSNASEMGGQRAAAYWFRVALEKEEFTSPVEKKLIDRIIKSLAKADDGSDLLHDMFPKDRSCLLIESTITAAKQGNPVSKERLIKQLTETNHRTVSYLDEIAEACGMKAYALRAFMQYQARDYAFPDQITVASATRWAQLFERVPEIESNKTVNDLLSLKAAVEESGISFRRVALVDLYEAGGSDLVENFCRNLILKAKDQDRHEVEINLLKNGADVLDRYLEVNFKHQVAKLEKEGITCRASLERYKDLYRQHLRNCDGDYEKVSSRYERWFLEFSPDAYDRVLNIHNKLYASPDLLRTYLAIFKSEGLFSLCQNVGRRYEKFLDQKISLDIPIDGGVETMMLIESSGFDFTANIKQEPWDQRVKAFGKLMGFLARMQSHEERSFFISEHLNHSGLKEFLSQPKRFFTRHGI